MKTLLSCAAAALVCHGASADVQLTMLEKHAGAMQGEMTTEISVRDGKVLFRQKGDGDGSDIVFDAAAGEITQIDHASKSYMVMDKASMQAGISRASEMMKQVEAQLANLPKEQREMMMKSMPGLSEQMGNKAKPVYDMERTGKSREVAGYDCKVVRVRKDGRPDGEACIADRKELGMSDDDFETLAKMFEMMDEMASMGNDSGMPDMRELGGYPIAYDNPEEGSRSALTQVSNDDLDAERFAVPDGYRLRAMPEY